MDFFYTLSVTGRTRFMNGGQKLRDTWTAEPESPALLRFGVNSIRLQHTGACGPF